MIPARAVEAAADVFERIVGSRDTLAAEKMLEAAVPHLLTQATEDREKVEERVKEIMQDIAMTVDYTERMYAAVQEIMNLTMPRTTKIPPQAVEAAAKALYEVYPSLDDPDDEATAVPWEFASEQRREEDTAQAIAVLKAVGYL